VKPTVLLASSRPFSKLFAPVRGLASLSLRAGQAPFHFKNSFFEEAPCSAPPIDTAPKTFTNRRGAALRHRRRL